MDGWVILFVLIVFLGENNGLSSSSEFQLFKLIYWKKEQNKIRSWTKAYSNSEQPHSAQ